MFQRSVFQTAQRFCFWLLLVSAMMGFVASDGYTDELSEQLYQHLLNEPANIAINQKLLSHQLQTGDLKGASATLERLAILAPASPSQLAVHMTVLARLGNIAEAGLIARRLLSHTDIDEHIIRQASAVAERASAQPSSTAPRLSGQIQIGAGLHRNPDGASQGNRAQLYDPVSDSILYSEYSKTNRTDELTTLSTSLTSLFPDKRGLNRDTRLSLSARQADYLPASQHTRQAMTASLGYQIGPNNHFVDAEFSLSATELGFQRFADEQSLRLLANWSDQTSGVSAQTQLARIDFRPASEQPHSGWQKRLSLATSLSTPHFDITFAITSERHDAEILSYGYEDYSLRSILSHTGQNGALSLSVQSGQRTYHAPERFADNGDIIYLATSPRSDRYLRTSLSLTDIIWGRRTFTLMSGITLSAQKTTSNIVNFTRMSQMAQISLSLEY